MKEQGPASAPSDGEDRYREAMGTLYDLEERTDRDLKDIRQILKNALERLIEKKIGYYL